MQWTILIGGSMSFSSFIIYDAISVLQSSE